MGNALQALLLEATLYNRIVRGCLLVISYLQYRLHSLHCQIKNPHRKKKPLDEGAVRVGEMHKKIDVGEDYCIPPTFRREHQFRITYFELQNRLGIWSLAHPIGLYYSATEDLHTLARSRQA